jgi:hypothetical protein
MRRRVALYVTFGLFGCVYATAERLPRSAAELLRSPAEHVSRSTSLESAVAAKGKLPGRRPT